MEQKHEVLRIWAESLYDHQDVRLRSHNRVRNLIRRKLLDLGFKPEKKKKKEEDVPEGSEWDDKKLIKLLKEAEKKKLLSEADHSFLTKSLELAQNEHQVEKDYEKELRPLIEAEPIWMEWLQYVNGISTRNTTRLLKHFGYCERFDTISKLWAYSGLKVQDGHAVMRKKGELLGYNLKIKTAMVGVIGDCLIKSNKSYKKRIYDTYKKRIQARGCCEKKHSKHKGKMCKDYPGHSARMAQRKMVKIFLAHYWLKCRELKGLETRGPYAVDKMKHTTNIKPFYDKQPDKQ
ncbi:hypothetical protein LCGC14_0484750 [marine sediment metagenome]|uniref:Uncharacterized protein n=1 Tax=marine sediment metagenome TaxID=412755 RepID=A0A0F9SRG3_9ZZZZ